MVNRNSRGSISLWQLALYIAVLGIISLFLAPITAIWWIVPLLGAAMPVVLTRIQGQEHRGTAADRTPAITQDPKVRDLDRMDHHLSDEHPVLETGVGGNAAWLAAADTVLSQREQEVLAQLAAGKTNAEVAEVLYISIGTVKSHSANIYRKLEAKNRTEAVARARELGLLK
ncbi:MAG: response regulator transcription factor [Thermomicrobiales bacterium]